MKTKPKEETEYPCYNCQGGGCEVCDGSGVLINLNS